MLSYQFRTTPQKMKYYVQDVILDNASLLRAPLLPVLIPMIKTGLRKVVLVGDSRQNSPYGSTAEKQVPSMLDRSLASYSGPFLSLQHRMPMKELSHGGSRKVKLSSRCSMTSREAPQSGIMWSCINVHPSFKGIHYSTMTRIQFTCRNGN